MALRCRRLQFRGRSPWTALSSAIVHQSGCGAALAARARAEGVVTDSIAAHEHRAAHASWDIVGRRKIAVIGFVGDEFRRPASSFAEEVAPKAPGELKQSSRRHHEGFVGRHRRSALRRVRRALLAVVTGRRAARPGAREAAEFVAREALVGKGTHHVASTLALAREAR